MRDTGLIEYYPDLKMLKHTPQDKIYHPEGDVEIHTELCLTHLDKLIKETDPMVAITGPEMIIVVMATLLHDIAKPQTTEEQMKNDRMTITSHGHEAMGGVVAKKFLSGIGFSDELTYPICNIIANHLAGVNISVITSPAGQVKAVKKLSRRLHPATITQLLCVMKADTNGRGGTEYKAPTGGNEIADIAMSLKVTEKQYEYVLMGRHLMELGLQPSEQFGIILKASYDAQENGLFNDLESGKKWLKDNFELLKGLC
jgi:tRNA nucleotidyltransferase (CCA-adding enzyme)